MTSNLTGFASILDKKSSFEQNKFPIFKHIIYLLISNDKFTYASNKLHCILVQYQTSFGN